MIDLVKLLPHSRNKHYVLFLNNGIKSLGLHVTDHAAELKKAFTDEDYIFLPLAEIEASITPDMMEYMFPWRGLSVYRGGVERMFRQVYQIGNKAGLLRIDGKKTDFFPIKGEDEFSFDDAAMDLLLKLQTEAGPDSEDLFSMLEPEPIQAPSMPAKRRGICYEGSARLSRKMFDQMPDIDEEPLDENTQTVVAAWNDFSRRYGISIEDLARLLNEKAKISRLIIKPSGTILLADYDDKEVKMDDLTKALYFLYLLHPEGIRQKELIDYKDELLDLYLKITRRDDLDEIRFSVESLLFDENRINVSMSRIKKAFRDLFGDWLAKTYYIDGTAGKARSIKLNRDYVIWEH